MVLFSTYTAFITNETFWICAKQMIKMFFCPISTDVPSEYQPLCPNIFPTYHMTYLLMGYSKSAYEKSAKMTFPKTKSLWGCLTGLALLGFSVGQCQAGQITLRHPGWKSCRLPFWNGGGSIRVWIGWRTQTKCHPTPSCVHIVAFSHPLERDRPALFQIHQTHKRWDTGTLLFIFWGKKPYKTEPTILPQKRPGHMTVGVSFPPRWPKRNPSEWLTWNQGPDPNLHFVPPLSGSVPKKNFRATFPPARTELQ